MFPTLCVTSPPPVSYLFIVINFSVVNSHYICTTPLEFAVKFEWRTLLCGTYCAKNVSVCFLGGGVLVGTVATILFFKRKYTPF
jgi:hypothetical protein